MSDASLGGRLELSLDTRVLLDNLTVDSKGAWAGAPWAFPIGRDSPHRQPCATDSALEPLYNLQGSSTTA